MQLALLESFIVSAYEMQKLNNNASLNAKTNAGIVYEGVSKKYLHINGVWEDHVRYALLNNETER